MDDAIKKVKTIVQSGDKRDILVLALLLDAVFVFSVTICSFVIAGTAYAGFNIVLTSLLNIGYISGSYYVITNSKTPIAIGFLIGVSATMSVLNFMTAIYWGQLSRCTGNILNYCTNPAAYRAVSAFSVLIFLLQSAVCAAIVLWRNELISEEGGLYDDVSGGSSQPHLAGGAYEHLKGSPYPSATTSADL